MQLNDIKIVLSRAEEAGNVGAVCRAMKNMGLSHLRLASVGYLNLEKIHERAVHAWDIWENAHFYDNLASSVSDCSIIVGTTRRRGQKRKNISMPPRELATWLSKRSGPIAIVFGNERTGLEEEELELCNIASHIPVSPVCPSLNLSHAVQVYAYELFLAMGKQLPVKGEWNAMNQGEITNLTCGITDTLEDLGFYKKLNKKGQMRFLHDIIARAGLTGREGQYLKDIFTKTANLVKKQFS